ncbi:ATP synthase F1 subunit gamma [Pedosphaera parvula]|uniref:ATP synthase gamma chain n=1 Tax=Pedosphaera parvula (strain Ellin514) TaxID=320771 RepID=B9XPE8_PEDPL|nr:ATP synthase F1 subunit gamma [Pedosphaera parvula]EEF58288.1 ATP synthase F1, gamma subunit [Pedosphaera parvula Ellin514]
MPSTRDIRRRIKSVKNTAQITKAMQMVAASKMRKAQGAALAGRPYATLMNEVLAEVTTGAGDFTHPLLEKREVKKRALIVVSTDKGLCGGLNSNLMREAAKFDRDITVFITAGRKGSQFIARTKRQLVAEFTYKDAPLFSEARAISRFAREMFEKGEVDQVDILFTNFISTLNQKPEVVPFLPVGEITGVTAGVHGHANVEALAKGTTEFIYEPGVAGVLGALLPHYLNFKVYQILLEAKASEHSSRMVAMKNATDNAKQLIKDLTLEYNKLRQANITKELLEITSAAMAMS